MKSLVLFLSLASGSLFASDLYKNNVDQKCRAEKSKLEILDLICRYYQATVKYAPGSEELAGEMKAILTKDVVFEGPLVQTDTLEGFNQGLNFFLATVNGLSIKEIYLKNDRAVVISDLSTKFGKTLKFSESWKLVKSGGKAKLSELRLRFDPRDFDAFVQHQMRVRNAELKKVRKLIKKDLVEAFMQLPNEKKMRSILADDVKLRWVKKRGNSKDDFLRIIKKGFARDRALFIVAAKNYQYLVNNCGLKDGAQRPVGLPKTVNLKTFDFNRITADDIKKHPGLFGFQVIPRKDLIGRDEAAGRYIMVADFKHPWMKVGAKAYPYIDRYVVARRGKELKIVEYEFTADLVDDVPAEPKPIHRCPK